MDHHEIKYRLSIKGISLTDIGDRVGENVMMVGNVTRSGKIETIRHYKIAREIATELAKKSISEIFPKIDKDVFNVQVNRAASAA